MAFLFDFPPNPADNFSYNTLPGSTVTIPLEQEMRIYQSLDSTSGTIQINGTLIIMDV